MFGENQNSPRSFKYLLSFPSRFKGGRFRDFHYAYKICLENLFFKITCLSGTLPQPQPAGKLLRIYDSDFIPCAWAAPHGHHL